MDRPAPIAPLTALSAFAMAMVLVACAGSPPGASAPAPVYEKAGAPQLSLVGAPSGSSVVIDASQELVVTLALTPTSGLEWTIVDLSPGVLRPVGSRFERSLRDANPGESTGTMIFRFKPQAPGQVTLNFDLRRPRSLLPAVQSVSYRVTVR